MTRSTLIVALIVVAPSMLHSQNPPPRDPAQLLSPAGTAVISGVVVDADNKPMRQVAVRIEGDPRASRTVMTDDAGRFAFTRVPAGEFFLRAKKPAYPEVSYGAKRPGRAGVRLQIKDGARIDNIVLKMERGAVLTGTVVNDRGQPVPDVSVTAYRVYTGLDGTFSTSSVSFGSTFPKTDDRGVYRFYGLPAGEYIVGTSPFFGSVSSARVPTDEEIREAFARAQQAALNPTEAARPRPTRAESQQMDYTPVYYPDAPNAVDATRIRVSAGEERAELDLRLTLRPTAAISGRVTNLGDAKSVEMLLVTRAQGSTLHTGANADHSFNFRGLPAGDYTVAARTNGPQPLIASADITLNGRDVDGVNLDLAPPAAFPGKVVVNASTLPPPVFSQIRISVSPTTPRGFGISASATPAADGTFILQGMLPGTYQIVTSVIGVSGGAVPFTMVSTFMGDRDVTDVPVVITAGALLAPLTITLSDTASELSGQLTLPDGKPATDYYVIAVAADQRYWLWNTRRIKSARPNAGGRYVFSGLPPGIYRVAATTDLENSDLQDRTFLEQIVAASAEVTIGAGEKKVFDLKLGGG